MSTRPTEYQDIDFQPVDFRSIQAAAEIELDPGSTPTQTFYRKARPIPATPSYFTRTPKFNDSFLTLESLSRTYGNLPTIPPSQVQRVAWQNLEDLKLSLGEPIKSTDFSRCLALVKKLHNIHPKLKPKVIKDALEPFKKEVQPFLSEKSVATIDKYGRAHAAGKRKSSVALVWLVEGFGEVLINGKTLPEYFGRVHDRESALWALHATDRLGKYNVWAKVEGGGTTGQAEALTLGIARALMIHEPALKPALRRGKRSLSWLMPQIYGGKHADRSIPSRLRDTRSKKGGEEEGWSRQGQKVAHMGKEIVQAQSKSIEHLVLRMNRHPTLRFSVQILYHVTFVPSYLPAYISASPVFAPGLAPGGSRVPAEEHTKLYYNLPKRRPTMLANSVDRPHEPRNTGKSTT
jgi:small subunit ribosomal protein S9